MSFSLVIKKGGKGKRGEPTSYLWVFKIEMAIASTIKVDRRGKKKERVVRTEGAHGGKLGESWVHLGPE